MDRGGRIYVDVDDVLAQTGRMFLRLLERDFGRRVAFEQIHSYHLGDSFRLDEEELAEFMRRAHEPAELAAVEPMPGAAAALERWRVAGYEIWVVTGRPAETRGTTLAWLERHGFAFTEFHFLDKYSQFYDGAHGSQDGTLTLPELAGLDLRLAVEDFPGTAAYLAGELGVPVALFDRPWNRDPELEAGAAPLVRCAGWEAVERSFPAP